KEEPIVKVEEMENKLIGLKNVEGEETTSTRGKSEPEPKSDGGGKGTNPAPTGNYSARQVSEMAIYPGCERHRGDKTKLTQCFQNNLTQELIDQLSDVAEIMNNRGESQAVTRLQFVVDKSGKIIQVQAQQGVGGGINVELGKEAEKALQRIASRLANRGRTIQPAKLEDGSEVNLSFQIPVRYVIQN